MESLRLEGTTIRGLVKGRQVNCIVRSVPDGLVLPPGQYLLRVGENNPIYGLFLSVEAAAAPGAAASALKWTPDAAPAILKDSPAAVATLVPTQAYSAKWKLPPATLKDVAAAKFDAPAVKLAPASKVDAPAIKFAPASKVDAPAVKFAPASKVDAPAVKFAPASKVDAPASKFDAPASKFDAPANKAVAPAIKAVDAPAVKIEAPSIKFDFVPGQGLTARVIIAVRPIGQNSLVAQAGFSDLVDAVQQAGGVTLIVA